MYLFMTAVGGFLNFLWVDIEVEVYSSLLLWDKERLLGYCHAIFEWTIITDIIIVVSNKINTLPLNKCDKKLEGVKKKNSDKGSPRNRNNCQK